MTPFRLTFETRSADQTQAAAKRIGQHIRHPLVMALTGDLGAGKTAFIQGLARGLGVPDRYYVTSPTFTLINEYPGRIGLYHVDLYRISDLEEIYDLGLEEILLAEAVTAIEWADKLSDILPTAHLAVAIEIRPADRRVFHLTGYGREPVNLLKGIEKSLEESSWP